MAAIKSFLIYITYCLCFLIPRKKRLWLYSSLNGEFLDNAKYFFLYAVKNCKDVRHVWISGSNKTIAFLQGKGFEAYHIDSGKAKKLALQAGALIYSSHITSICNPAFGGGAFRFNLWHGIPLKKIEYDIYKGPLRYLYNPANFSEWWKRFCTSPALIRRNDAVLTTSSALKKIFSSAFRLPEQKIFTGQYPRLMPFTWSNEQLRKHIEQIEGEEMLKTVGIFKNFASVIVYMPTWRDDDPGFITQAIPDFSLLDKTCGEKNILFVLKLHINTVFNEDISSYQNILLLNSNLDMYPLLPYSTMLLTDYSSIFFDYAVLNKKIIFYPFDFSDYKSKNRELYFDFDEITKGELVIYTFNELIKAISDSNQPVSEKHTFDKFLNTSFDYDAQIQFVKDKAGSK